MSLLLDLLMGAIRSPIAGEMQQALSDRQNTPSGALDHILQPSTSAADRDNCLWVVDRIMEPQTVMHFVDFTFRGQLPSGRQTSLSLLSEDDFEYLQLPLSEWAPAPYNKNTNSVITAVMNNIGSEEDGDRLVPISKELIAMKSRIWEGIMPVSERRWKELDLDSPDHFSMACQCIAAVTNVFHYLNLPQIKADLRETYNRIWQHFDIFDKAMQGFTSKKSPSDLSMAALWHEYIKDHYDFISYRSHSWVIEHIDRLRVPILEKLSNGTLVSRSDPQFALTDQIHDLLENGAQADSAIFIPTDGYKGDALSAQDDVNVDTSNPYREEPIQYSASTLSRQADYYSRLKHLSRIETWSGDGAGDLGNAATAKSQVRAQLRARAELRGDQAPLHSQELWVSRAMQFLNEGTSLEWGFIGYRTYYDCSDEEWDLFKTKFNTDISNWGTELKDIDSIKALSNVEWKDIRDQITTGGDGISAAKKAFAALTASEDDNRSFREDVFLVADKTAIESYLSTEKSDSGHVLVVDADDGEGQPMDPNRMEESPGFDGWLRILGSLLWDDFSAGLLTQTQDLMSLWPLAQNDSLRIYRHPVGPVTAKI